MSTNKLTVDLDEWNKCQSERDALKTQKETLQNSLYKSEAEISRLKAEVEKLRIVDKYRTSPTPWLVAECDHWRTLAEKAREALENIKKHMSLAVDPPHMSAVWNMADRALALFSSDPPIGQQLAGQDGEIPHDPMMDAGKENL